MIFKWIVFIILLVILYALGSGLFYLAREGFESKRLVRALTWRIVLSLALFGFLILAYFVGWVVPHALVLSR